ncbi:hypothetical protein N0V90_006043 [Kalmusia sp. IMI 367209]|nr:hypothetical protein N0V90_006043 [Kalmusia sp. IMI 367209]
MAGSNPIPYNDEKPAMMPIEFVNEKGPSAEGVSQVDPEVQKTLLRKLDYRMMPVFFVMYFLNHWDRNGLPQARLNDIEKHLGLKGVQYNVCISILYVGYLIAGVPSNMLITRVRPSVYLGMAATASMDGNGKVNSATMIILLMQYRLFIVEGCLTFGFAIIGIFLLPDTPGKTRWMSDAENRCALQRHEEDSVNQLGSESPLQGLISALKDYKVWLLMLMQNLHFSGMSFNQFFPTIVKTL